MPFPSHPEATKREFKLRYKQGQLLKKIAFDLGIGLNTATRWRKQFGLSRMRHRNETDTRTVHVMFKLGEYIEIQTRATAQGMPVTDYIRNTMREKIR